MILRFYHCEDKDRFRSRDLQFETISSTIESHLVKVRKEKTMVTWTVGIQTVAVIERARIERAKTLWHDIIDWVASRAAFTKNVK